MDEIVKVMCANVKKRYNAFEKCREMNRLFKLYYSYEKLHTSTEKSKKYGNSFIRCALHLVEQFSTDESKTLDEPFMYRDNVDAVREGLKNGEIKQHKRNYEILDDKDMQLLFHLTESILPAFIRGGNNHRRGVHIQLFYRAHIYGVQFRSRGLTCKEETYHPNVADLRYGSSSSNYRYWPENEKNILRNNWSDVHQYSSWAKLRCKSNEVMKIDSFGHEQYLNTEDYVYGQLNFFFQLSIPSDPDLLQELQGFTLASVTCRHHTTINYVDHIIANNDGDSYFKDKQYVALDDVCSTPILLCALKSNCTEEKDGFLTSIKGQVKTNIPNYNQNKNETFAVRRERILKSMKATAEPFFLGMNAEDESSYPEYAKMDDASSVSYIVALEMYRNRYLIYNDINKSWYPHTTTETTMSYKLTLYDDSNDDDDDNDDADDDDAYDNHSE
jgi:hypothetical protein